MAEEKCLDKLKENYQKIQEKYNLPEFQRLNEDFQIERISETETDFLIREVRKFIAEKLFNCYKLVETLLNPTNAPMFVFSMIKSLGENEKKKLEEIYKKLAKNEVKLIKIDIEFSEENEALFIKNSYNLWQEIKRDFLEILKIVEENWGNKLPGKNGNYFG